MHDHHIPLARGAQPVKTASEITARNDVIVHRKHADDIRVAVYEFGHAHYLVAVHSSATQFQVHLDRAGMKQVAALFTLFPDEAQS